MLDGVQRYLVSSVYDIMKLLPSGGTDNFALLRLLFLAST